jgi:hypothetical protein
MVWHEREHTGSRILSHGSLGDGREDGI